MVVLHHLFFGAGVNPKVDGVLCLWCCGELVDFVDPSLRLYLLVDWYPLLTVLRIVSNLVE